jgi:putative ABC transport system permease protein
VAQHIRDWLYFNVYTTAQERELMLEGRLSRMSAVLGLFRTLLILVSIVIIALIVYVLTIEKIRSIATLKLIGAPNGLIVIITHRRC